jgi:ankyrin repeat protein
MTSARSHGKWRALALFAGLAELAVIGGVVSADPPSSFDAGIAAVKLSLLLAPLALGGWAARRLERSPVLWISISVALWGAGFLLIAWLGAAPARRVGYWSKRGVVRAVRRGDLAHVQRILRAGFPVDVPLDWLLRRTALMEAGFTGQLEIARALLDAGADTNARSRSGETPLMLACAGGHPALVRLLIERGADVRAEAHGSNPLGFAIHYGHAEVARVLLEAGAQTSDRVVDRTALLAAQERGRADVLHVLQERAELEARRDRQRTFFDRFEQALGKGGVGTLVSELDDVNLRGPHGTTPLFVAAHRGHLEAVDQLLGAGADVEARDDAGRTALHAAVEEDSLPVTRKLLEAGAEVEAADSNGETPLLAACRRGSGSVLGALLSAGANRNSRDRKGVSALVLAARSGHWQLERDLLAAGAAPDAAYDEMTGSLFDAAIARGMAPELAWRLSGCSDPEARRRRASAGLLAAAARGHEQAVDTLIQAGARIDSVDENGATPMSLALDTGHSAVVERLIQAGGDFGGSAALMTACRRGWPSLARVLLKAGADVNARDASGASVLLAAARAGLGDLEGELLAAGAVADEAYRQFVESREHARELERERRAREKREAQEREASRRARVRAIAGHQKCARCAAGRAWFIGRALAALGRGGTSERPHDFAGGCETCQDCFCSGHAQNGLCPFCGGALR